VRGLPRRGGCRLFKFDRDFSQGGCVWDGFGPFTRPSRDRVLQQGPQAGPVGRAPSQGDRGVRGSGLGLRGRGLRGLPVGGAAGGLACQGSRLRRGPVFGGAQGAVGGGGGRVRGCSARTCRRCGGDRVRGGRPGGRGGVTLLAQGVDEGEDGVLCIIAPSAPSFEAVGQIEGGEGVVEEGAGGVVAWAGGLEGEERGGCGGGSVGCRARRMRSLVGSAEDSVVCFLLFLAHLVGVTT